MTFFQEPASTASIHVHEGDLPAGLSFPQGIAIDCETMGLKNNRDRLCLVQVSSGDGAAHLVRVAATPAAAPNLRAVLEDASVPKLLHFARFDMLALHSAYGVMMENVFCSKIASKILRTYTDRHGLKDLCRELLGVELSKAQQSSYWGAEQLSPEQQQYAACDVLYLHALRGVIEERLEREGRLALAQDCMRFLPTRALLDARGWEEVDIFAHS